MSTRDIQGHVEDLYEVATWPELVSRSTATVTDVVLPWQSRAVTAPGRSLSDPVPDPGCQPKGRKGIPGSLDRAERRRVVLALRPDRTE